MLSDSVWFGANSRPNRFPGLHDAFPRTETRQWLQGPVDKSIELFGAIFVRVFQKFALSFVRFFFYRTP